MIEVIGVGGAGCNAVDHMIREGVMGVEFIAVDDDAQILERSLAPRKLHLKETGLDSDTGREQITKVLKGTHMLFIVAGMGGGTGTGAALAIAGIAREKDILTVAVVARPFDAEGERVRIAEAGIAELQKHVDSLIVVPNDRRMNEVGENTFKAVDDMLRRAVGGIAEIVNFPGLINVDFEDVRALMRRMGRAVMGSACASGSERARVAARNAILSLEQRNLSGTRAKGVLINITASRRLKRAEIIEVLNAMREFIADDASLVFGAVYDESMGEEMCVTVIAASLATDSATASDRATLRTFEAIHASLSRAMGADDSPIDAPLLDQRHEPTDEQLGSIMSAVAAKARERAARADAILHATIEREVEAALAAHRQRTERYG
jgi:cell division protein FtsZ